MTRKKTDPALVRSGHGTPAASPALRIVPSPNRVADNDDASLVGAAKRGDAAAFASLYRRHARTIAGVAYRIVGDDVELDDIVQEVFLEAHRGLGSIQDPARVRAWLITVAVRRARRRIGKRVRRRAIEEQVRHCAPRMGDPRNQARADALYDALDRIDPDLRIPWVLSRVEGFRIPEVASACGVSPATAKRRIARAQKRLDIRLGTVRAERGAG